MALYTDRAHWAFHTPKAKGPVDKTRLTQVGRALARLGHRAHSRPIRRRRAAAVSGSIARSRIGWSTSCASRASRRSRRPTRICADAFVPQHNATFARAPRDPASAFVPLGRGRSRRDPVSRRGARRRRATTPSRIGGRVLQIAPQPGRRSCAGLHGHRPPASRRAATRSRAAAQRLGTLRARRAAYGRCRRRGRQERAHRSLENAQNAFPTAPTGVTLAKAVRSLVKRKRTDHLSTTLRTRKAFFLPAGAPPTASVRTATTAG